MVIRLRFEWFVISSALVLALLFSAFWFVVSASADHTSLHRSYQADTARYTALSEYYLELADAQQSTLDTYAARYQGLAEYWAEIVADPYEGLAEYWASEIEVDPYEGLAEYWASEIEADPYEGLAEYWASR